MRRVGSGGIGATNVTRRAGLRAGLLTYALDVAKGSIQAARIGVTGAGPYATRLTNVEAALAGKPLSKETIAAAASASAGATTACSSCSR